MPAAPEIDPRQEWGTPPELFDPLNREFKFQLDACARKDNAKCADFITPEMDGLETSWVIPKKRERVFVNPGFRDPLPWYLRSYYEASKSPNAVVVVVGLVSPASDAFRWAHAHSVQVRLLGGKRVQFIPSEALKKILEQARAEKVKKLFNADKPKEARRLERSKLKDNNAHENITVVFRQKFSLEPAEITLWDYANVG